MPQLSQGEIKDMKYKCITGFFGVGLTGSITVSQKEVRLLQFKICVLPCEMRLLLGFFLTFNIVKMTTGMIQVTKGCLPPFALTFAIFKIMFSI